MAAAISISARESLLSLANLCKEFGDYSNMTLYMSELVESIEGAELTVEEREAFFGGAKMIMDFHRRRVDEVQLKEVETKTDAERALISKYLLRLYVELENACKTVLLTNRWLIQTHLELRRKDDSPNDIYLEPLVMYFLHEADCYRYISETYIPEAKRDDGDLGQNAYHARKSYEFAWDNARKLAILDIEKIPIMLKVAMKFSVFCSDIVSSPQESVNIANEAINTALPKMLKMSLASRNDSNSTMKTLKKNLPVWISNVKKQHAQGSSSRNGFQKQHTQGSSSRKEA